MAVRIYYVSQEFEIMEPSHKAKQQALKAQMVLNDHSMPSYKKVHNSLLAFKGMVLSVSGEYMTNQSLRNRFGIEEKNYFIASRIIAEGIKSGQIKDYDPESTSKKHAKYIPFWA